MLKIISLSIFGLAQPKTTILGVGDLIMASSGADEDNTHIFDFLQNMFNYTDSSNDEEYEIINMAIDADTFYGSNCVSV